MWTAGVLTPDYWLKEVNRRALMVDVWLLIAERASGAPGNESEEVA
jgi:hypothetical protein